MLVQPTFFLFQTNIPFLMNVLRHPQFLEGFVDTDFLKQNPQLFDIKRSKNRAQKLLHYLGNVMINGPVTPLATNLKPSKIEPTVPKVNITNLAQVGFPYCISLEWTSFLPAVCLPYICAGLTP